MVIEDRSVKSADELRALPEVATAIYHIERGGFVEAVIRMLILLADKRGTVRRDRLERSSRVLTQDEPFKSFGAGRRAMVIHEQTIIATYEPDRAIETLPALLPDPADRALASAVVRFVPGRIDEMTPETLSLMQRFQEVLGLPAVTSDIEDDPLQSPMALQRFGGTAPEIEKGAAE
jgi:hypothetical protein